MKGPWLFMLINVRRTSGSVQNVPRNSTMGKVKYFTMSMYILDALLIVHTGIKMLHEYIRN